MVTCYLLISVWALASRFFIFCAVNIRTIIKSAVTFFNWTTTTLIKKMPMKTAKRAMLCTLMLKEQGTLLSAKLLQVPEKIYKKKVNDSIPLNLIPKLNFNRICPIAISTANLHIMMRLLCLCSMLRSF